MLFDFVCCAMLLATTEATTTAAAESAAAAVQGECPCKQGVCACPCKKGGGECAAEVKAGCEGCKKSATALETTAEAEECSGCKSQCATKAKATCGGAKCTTCAKAGGPADPAVIQATAIMPATTEQQELLREKLAQRDELQREIDELCAATQSWQQVLVQVRVLEVNLTKMRKLGVDFSYVNGSTVEVVRGEELVNGALGGTAYSSEANCQATAGCQAGECGNGRLAFLDLLEQQNLAKVIAEPSLVTVSGRPASVQIGGELPIPSGKDAPTACSFVSFGTRLDVLATAMGNNKVRLEVRPRVSEVREGQSLVVEGHKIPAFNVTECDTACELQFGQTAALTGLVQRRVESVSDEDGRVREEPCDVMLMVVVTPQEFVRGGEAAR